MKKLRLKRIITIVFLKLISQTVFQSSVTFDIMLKRPIGPYEHEAVIMPFAEFLKTESLDTTSTHALFK